MHGKRVCWMHGGAAPGAPIRHGRYSKALEGQPHVRENYEIAKNDPHLQETLNEIALLRAKLQWYLEEHADENAADVLVQIRE